jgi:hypothetical protein
MTYLSAIYVIHFYGKSDEWPFWSEKILAKAKRYGFKDVLLWKAMMLSNFLTETQKLQIRYY